jgi:hypothetical protein
MLAIDHRVNQYRQNTTAMRFAEGLLKEGAVEPPLAAADSVGPPLSCFRESG